MKAGPSRVEAEVFLLPMASDLLMFPEDSRRAAIMLRALGKKVARLEVQGDPGHADDVISITRIEDELRAFLES